MDTGTTTRSRQDEWMRVQYHNGPKRRKRQNETARKESQIAGTLRVPSLINESARTKQLHVLCSLLLGETSTCAEYVSNEISVIVPLRVAGVQQLIRSSQLQSLGHHHLDEFLAHSYVPHRWSITMLHLMRRRPREISDAQIQQCNGFGTHLCRRFPRN